MVLAERGTEMRKKTVSKYTLFLTSGRNVELVADMLELPGEGKFTEFRKDSKLVGKFQTSMIAGYTKEYLEDNVK